MGATVSAAMPVSLEVGGTTVPGATDGSDRIVRHSQAYASPHYRGVVEGGVQVSQQSAPYRGESVYDDLGLDLGRVEAYRSRTWIDIKMPNISGKRVDINVVVQTLEQWGGWNAV